MIKNIDEFEAKIQVLIDIVSDKNTKLNQVLNITLNQETLLKVPEPTEEISQLFNQMNTEKQVVIDEVLDGDEVFNKIFEGLDDFEEKAPLYRETVRELQRVVKIAADLDMNIRIAEEKNKSIVSSKSGARTGVIRGGKQDLLNKYKTNYKKDGGE